MGSESLVAVVVRDVGDVGDDVKWVWVTSQTSLSLSRLFRFSARFVRFLFLWTVVSKIAKNGVSGQTVLTNVLHSFFLCTLSKGFWPVAAVWVNSGPFGRRLFFYFH